MQQLNEFEYHTHDVGMFDSYMLFLMIRTVETKNAAKTENDSLI